LHAYAQYLFLGKNIIWRCRKEEKTVKKIDSKRKKDVWFAVILIIVSLACVFVAEENFGDASKIAPGVAFFAACMLLIWVYVDIDLVSRLLAPYMAMLVIAGLPACLGYTVRQDWSGIAGGIVAGGFLAKFIVPWRNGYGME
jgi:uncharacterized Tic20 family protein